MKSLQKLIFKGVSGIAFPEICELCGFHLSSTEHAVCRQCITDKFDYANPEYRMIASGGILPEGVKIQHALWNFDKGGYLQDLLHLLKYGRIAGVGTDLGLALGRSIKRHQGFSSEDSYFIIPVPLHPKKFRKRGYNQAEVIAQGISEIIGHPVIDRDDVVRIKNTKTQTGFTLEKRQENISSAFEVRNIKKLKNKRCIIVDDVFTTGATTFELAKTLKTAEVSDIFIATVAQA